MKKTISLVVSAVFMVVLMSGVALSAGERAAEKALSAGEQASEQGSKFVITGEVIENQLVDKKGNVYDIADNEKGKELLTHATQKVQIKGTLMESEGKRLITILDYKIIKE